MRCIAPQSGISSDTIRLSNLRPRDNNSELLMRARGMIRAVRRSLLIASLLLVCSCSTPPPPAPVAPPTTPAPPPAQSVSVEEKVIGTVRVTASALNVRAEASADSDVIAQVKRGTALSVIGEGDGWVRVRLASGETGWVAERFVSSGSAKAAAPRRASNSKCPPDSDYAFTETPQLRGSDRTAHGLVVVEANVNTKGVVTSTKVMTNTTGDEALAFLAEKEIQSARFSPPIRNCVPRAFIFTYRRTF